MLSVYNWMQMNSLDRKHNCVKNTYVNVLLLIDFYFNPTQIRSATRTLSENPSLSLTILHLLHVPSYQGRNFNFFGGDVCDFRQVIWPIRNNFVETCAVIFSLWFGNGYLKNSDERKKSVKFEKTRVRVCTLGGTRRPCLISSLITSPPLACHSPGFPVHFAPVFSIEYLSPPLPRSPRSDGRPCPGPSRRILFRLPLPFAKTSCVQTSRACGCPPRSRCDQRLRERARNGRRRRSDPPLCTTHMCRTCRRRPAWSRPGICTRRRCAADWWPRTGTRIRSPRWPAPRARYRTRNGCPGTRPGRTRVGGRANTTSRPRRSSGCCSTRGRLERKPKKTVRPSTPRPPQARTAAVRWGVGVESNHPPPVHRVCWWGHAMELKSRY